MGARSVKSTRVDNRLGAVRDAAARLFAERGYAATSMRDIAAACGMLPGSLYYHFAAKEDLLVAVYEAGVEQLTTAVVQAAGVADPWARLEAVCAAHLEVLLERRDYAQVLVRVLPSDVSGAAARLRALRADYERNFRECVRALALPAHCDRGMLRLMLLGALNWSCFWFAAGGRETPRTLARKFVVLLKEAQHG